MELTDTNTTLPEPERRLYRLPRGIEAVLHILVLALAGVFAHIGHDDPDPSQECWHLWFGIMVIFRLMTILRILRDRSTIPSAGELLGLAPVVLWLALFGASQITPEGELTLPLFLCAVPLYFVTSLISCGFLFAAVAGKRRHIAYKLIDF